jgi:hypothetical protein
MSLIQWTCLSVSLIIGFLSKLMERVNVFYFHNVYVR